MSSSTPPEVFVDVISTELMDDLVREKLGAAAEDVTTARIGRLRSAADRDAVLAAHVGLRCLVARAAAVPLTDVTIRRACRRCGSVDHGRPAATIAGGATWRASLSHTRGLAVVAATQATSIGVDAEGRGDASMWSEIAPRVFTVRERDLLADGADGTTFWVRKEAVLKCSGTGLLGSMAGIDVAALPASGGWIDAPSAAWVIDLPAPGEHAIALAAAEQVSTLVRYLDAAALAGR